MSDFEMTAFEQRLEQRLRNHSAVPVRPYDAGEIARSAMVRPQRRAYWPTWSLPALGRGYLFVILLTMIALTVAVYVGARLLLEQSPPRPYDEVLTRAGQMSIVRTDPIVVTLADGRVLIAGGEDGSTGSVPAEVFDPTTGGSSRVAGSSPVGWGSGVLLNDGRVLSIAFSQNMTSSFAHVFDPGAMTFRVIEQEGFSNAPPFGVTPSLAVLNDGRVLVSGGKRDVYETEISETAMLFDPTTEEFTPTGDMVVPRIGHALLTLDDGRVAVIGGYRAMGRAAEFIELYDPATGRFTASRDLEHPHYSMKAVQLPDGSLLAHSVQGSPTLDGIAAGSGAPRYVHFDPVSETLTEAVIGEGERGPSDGVLLRDGRVLLSGSTLREPNVVGPGTYWDLYENWAATLDPSTGDVTETVAPNTQDPGTATLADGRVVYAGGMAYPEVDENGNGTGEGFVVDWVDIFE